MRFGQLLPNTFEKRLALPAFVLELFEVVKDFVFFTLVTISCRHSAQFCHYAHANFLCAVAKALSPERSREESAA